ncbi:hypothetical protein ABKV19_014486, partial [Rosa sericea]
YFEIGKVPLQVELARPLDLEGTLEWCCNRFPEFQALCMCRIWLNHNYCLDMLWASFYVNVGFVYIQEAVEEKFSDTLRGGGILRMMMEMCHHVTWLRLFSQRFKRLVSAKQKFS